MNHLSYELHINFQNLHSSSHLQVIDPTCTLLSTYMYLLFGVLLLVYVVTVVNLKVFFETLIFCFNSYCYR